MQHEITEMMKYLTTQSLETPLDADKVYLEVVKPRKGRLYGLGSQGIVGPSEAGSSRGVPDYAPHGNE